MIFLWHTWLGPVRFRVDGVSARDILANLETRVKTAAQPASPTETASPPPAPTDVAKALDQDELKLVTSGELQGLPQETVTKLMKALDRIEAKLHAGQKITLDDPAVKAFLEQAQVLKDLLGNGKGPAGPTQAPVNQAAVEEKARQIVDRASGYTNEQEEKEILQLLKGASGNPAELRALLKELEKQGWTYEDLLGEMDSDDRKAEFLQLTAPAMDTDQKAEAIKQLAEGYTNTADETAMATLLASAPDHDAKEALLKALSAKEIPFERIVDELEDPAQRSQFANSYLKLEQYTELRSKGIPLTDAAVKQMQKETASVVGVADKRTEDGKALTTDVRTQIGKDQTAAKSPPPEGTPQGVAQANRTLVRDLDKRVADNTTRSKVIGDKIKENQTEVQKVDATLQQLEAKKAALENFLKNPEIQGENRASLQRSLDAINRDIAGLEGARSRLLDEQKDLKTAQGELEQVDTLLQKRRQRAVSDMLKAVEQGADASIAKEIGAPTRQALDNTESLLDAYNPNGSVEEKTQHIKALQLQAQKLEKQAGALEEQEKQSLAEAQRTKDAQPSVTGDGEFGDYQAGVKAARTLIAIEGKEKAREKLTAIYGPERAEKLLKEAADGPDLIGELQGNGAALALQINETFQTISADLTLAEREAGARTMTLTADGWKLLDQRPGSFGAVRTKVEDVGKQITATTQRIDELTQKRDEALKTLGLKGVADLPQDPDQFRAMVRKLTDEAMQQGETEKAVAIMKAVLILTVPDPLGQNIEQQISSLQEVKGELEKHRTDLQEFIKAETTARTGLQGDLNAALEKLGLEKLAAGQIDDGDLQKATETLTTQLGIKVVDKDGQPAPPNFRNPQLVEAIKNAVQIRDAVGQFVNNTLKSDFGYLDDDLKAKGVTQLSDEGMGRGISRLRQELGLKDEPAGRLNPQEEQELMALLRGENVATPASPLIKAVIDRKQKMALFTNQDLDQVERVIAKLSGNSQGAVTSDQLLAALRNGQLTGPERDAVLKLFKRDEQGNLVPTDLFRMMETAAYGGAADGVLGRVDTSKFRDFVKAAQGQIPIAGFSDQREAARRLRDAFEIVSLTEGTTDEKAVFDTLRSLDSTQRMSVAIAYQAMYGEDLNQRIQSEMSYRDKGEAVYLMSRPDISRRVADITRAGQSLETLKTTTRQSMEVLQNPDNRAKIAEIFSNPTIADEARRIFDAYHQATDPAQRQQLAEQFVRLNVKSGFSDPALADQACQVFQQFQSTTDPAQRQQLAEQFVQISAVDMADRLYLNGTLLDAEGWKRDTWHDLDVSTVNYYKTLARDTLEQYKQTTDPALRNQLAQRLLAQTARAQDALELQLKRERTANNDWIADLEVAVKVTKGVAVTATAIVVTIGTAGIGTAAGASALTIYGGAVVAGTVAGTAMGAGLEAEEQLLTKGRIDGDEWLKATHGHLTTAFTSSVTTVAGMGIGRLGTLGADYVGKAVGASKFWAAAAKTGTQFAVGGGMNLAFDAGGRGLQVLAGADPKQAFHNFSALEDVLVGGVTHVAGIRTQNWGTAASVLRDTTLTLGSTVAIREMTGRELTGEEIANLVANGIVVGTVSTKFSKGLENMKELRKQSPNASTMDIMRGAQAMERALVAGLTMEAALAAGIKEVNTPKGKTPTAPLEGPQVKKTTTPTEVEEPTKKTVVEEPDKKPVVEETTKPTVVEEPTVTTKTLPGTDAAEISPAKAKAILDQAKIPPAPIRALGVADATPQFLSEKGLGPKYTVKIGNQEVHLSPPYDLGGGRQAIVAYVPDGKGGVQVRAFYRSNSQGLWRSASHSGANGWIGKGIKEFVAPHDMVVDGVAYKKGDKVHTHLEESTNLPIALQKELNGISKNAPAVALSPDDAKQAFYGTLEPIGNANPKALGTEIKEVTSLGHFEETVPGVGGKEYGKPGTFKWHNEADKPSFKNLKPGTAPDFQIDHPIHGKLDAYVVPSENGQYNYMFLKDANGKTWLGAVEHANAGLTSFGVKDRVVLPDDLTMPAMEYDSQVPADVAAQNKRVTGAYVDASDYVHQLDVVKDFRSALLGESIPAKPVKPVLQSSLEEPAAVLTPKDATADNLVAPRATKVEPMPDPQEFNLQRNKGLAEVKKTNPQEFNEAYGRAQKIVADELAVEGGKPVDKISKLHAEAERLMKSNNPAEKLTGQILHEHLREIHFKQIQQDRAMSALGGESKLIDYYVEKQKKQVAQALVEKPLSLEEMKPIVREAIEKAKAKDSYNLEPSQVKEALERLKEVMKLPPEEQVKAFQEALERVKAGDFIDVTPADALLERVWSGMQSAKRQQLNLPPASELAKALATRFASRLDRQATTSDAAVQAKMKQLADLEASNPPAVKELPDFKQKTGEIKKRFEEMNRKGNQLEDFDAILRWAEEEQTFKSSYAKAQEEVNKVMKLPEAERFKALEELAKKYAGSSDPAEAMTGIILKDHAVNLRAEWAAPLVEKMLALPAELQKKPIPVTLGDDGKAIQPAQGAPISAEQQKSVIGKVNEAWQKIREVVHPNLLERAGPVKVEILPEKIDPKLVNTPPYKGHYNDNGHFRASYNSENGTMYISPATDPQTIAHEFGHHLENRAGVGVWNDVYQVLQKRTAGENAELLAELTGMKYRKTGAGAEFATKDDFSDAYMGKRYTDGNTELLSMVLERFTDPKFSSQLLARDPELFFAVQNALQKANAGPTGVKPTKSTVLGASLSDTPQPDLPTGQKVKVGDQDWFIAGRTNDGNVTLNRRSTRTTDPVQVVNDNLGTLQGRKVRAFEGGPQDYTIEGTGPIAGGKEGVLVRGPDGKLYGIEAAKLLNLNLTPGETLKVRRSSGTIEDFEFQAVNDQGKVVSSKTEQTTVSAETLAKQNPSLAPLLQPPPEIPVGQKIRYGGEDWQYAGRKSDGQVLIERTVTWPNDPLDIIGTNLPDMTQIPIKVGRNANPAKGQPKPYIDDGWQISGIGYDERGQRGVMVRKAGEGSKVISFEQLMRLNPDFFKPGQTLKVTRSDGSVSDWTFQGIDGQGRVVTTAREQVAVAGDKLALENTALAASLKAPVAKPPVELPATVKVMNVEEAQGVFKKSKITASPGEGYKVREKVIDPVTGQVKKIYHEVKPLTKEFLETKGLGPKYTVQAEGVTYHFSEPFQLGERTAMILYLDDGKGNISIQPVYRGNSGTEWRTPSHAGPDGYLGKGWHGEDTTNLPLALQKDISLIADRGTRQPLSVADANQAFYGGLPEGMGYIPKTNSEWAKIGENAPKVVDDGGHRFDWKTPMGEMSVSDPSHIKWSDPADKPQITAKQPDYEFTHPLRGKIRAYEFTSKNGELKYVFFRDAQDRTWVGAIESTKTGVNGKGTKLQQIDAGSLTVPAVEYLDQVPPHLRPTDRQGNPIHYEAIVDGRPVKTPYVDATQYVYQIDIVQEFRGVLDLPTPTQFPKLPD